MGSFKKCEFEESKVGYRDLLKLESSKRLKKTMVQGHEKESLSIGRRGEEVRGQQPQPSDIFFLCEGQNLV